MIELLTLKFTEDKDKVVHLDFDLYQKDNGLFTLTSSQMFAIIKLLEGSINTLKHDNLEDMR